MASSETKDTPKHKIQKKIEDMKSSEFPNEIEDLRMGMERRRFSYTCHIPERRSLKDRRRGIDRRKA